MKVFEEAARVLGGTPVDADTASEVAALLSRLEFEPPVCGSILSSLVSRWQLWKLADGHCARGQDAKLDNPGERRSRAH